MDNLLDSENFNRYVIEPALRKREELRKAKNEEPAAILIPQRK